MTGVAERLAENNKQSEVSKMEESETRRGASIVVK